MSTAHTPHKDESPLAGGLSNTASKQYSLDDTVNHDENKALLHWQSLFAMQGHCLYQVKAADGATAFLVTRWGMVRELSGLNEVAKFFALIGGKV